jgi:hypothetical protein
MDSDNVSLREFIEKNHILLSTIAVLVAIVAFLGTLPIGWLNYVLSFILIAGVIIVWREIQSQVPKKTKGSLFLFRYVLLWSFGGFILYWLIEFREIWHMFLFVPIFLLSFYIMIGSIKPLFKFKIISKIFGSENNKTELQKVLWGIFVVIAVIISLNITSVFTGPLNLLLDVIKDKLP